MKPNELFVLVDGLQFTPVADIDDYLKNAFEYEEGDIVISNHHSRTKSKVLSNQFATLLQEFKTPKTISEVIYTYAALLQDDPLHLADETFDLLMNMKKSGLLVPYNNLDNPVQKSLLSKNDTFGAYTVEKKCFGLEDTEVYQVKDTSGKLFALKILRASVNNHVKAMYYNELKIYQRLDGLVNPALKEHGVQDEILYFIIEWCTGLTCIREANTCRNVTTRKNVRKLIDISISVAEAFYHLHHQGVIHGDIHPPNIFISEKGLVKIIDYGYAVEKENENQIQRGGTGFYYEPEFALSLINKEKRSVLTEKGEQYSVAVLIYKLLTGQDYLEFSAEGSKLYRQVINDEPVPFIKHDLNFPEELETILAKALSKDPEKRYISLKHFAIALKKVRDSLISNPDFFSVNRENGVLAFSNFLTRKYGWNSNFIEKGLQAVPTSSVKYGAAGIAYMYYRMACIRQDPSLASLADIWINRATQFENNFNAGFYSPSIGLNAESVGKRSLYHSPVGVYLTQALISNAKGDFYVLSKSLKDFLTAAKQPCDKIDLALGKTGILIGCSQLLRELKNRKGINTVPIENLADSIIQELWSQIDSFHPMNGPNEIGNFGIAHGWAGFLYASLRWCNTANRKLPGNFLIRMEELLSCAVEKDNNIHWPYSITDNTPWHGWCNGSAGHSFLWLLAYQYFRDEKFIRVAEKLSNHYLKPAHDSNCNLCCGTAGMAYSTLGLYKTTHDKKYLDSVKRLNKMLLKNLTSPQLRNNSLYKGEIGIGVLFCESENPDMAMMPLFE